MIMKGDIMVKVIIGDLFDSKMQTLVNTINCVGVMGKGIALEFKKRFPEMFKDYENLCKRGQVKLGQPYLYKQMFGAWILNFPTKDHWRSVTSLQDIINGLEYLKTHYKEWGIKSLAVPPLGCGYGQLEWRVVGPTIYRYMKELDIPVELYAPYGTMPSELKHDFLETGIEPKKEKQREPYKNRINPAWVALVDILNRLEQEPHHWPVGRTIFQKIAYVATEEGLPTGFNYQRSSYGPFSKDFKNITIKLINNGLIREQRDGQMFKVAAGRTFEDSQKEFSNKLQEWESIIEKTKDLFMRVNTHQAELLSTVLFSYKTLINQSREKPTEIDVVDSVMQWKKLRRPKLDRDEVAKTVRNLAIYNWIHPAVSTNLPLPEEELCEI
jgi:uncharacterized protein YwgA/O-acetyl-ADP-ribose deacetylase (regulator of RNase III)